MHLLSQRGDDDNPQPMRLVDGPVLRLIERQVQGVPSPMRKHTMFQDVYWIVLFPGVSAEQINHLGVAVARGPSDGVIVVGAGR